jgi:hypothetical protein
MWKDIKNYEGIYQVSDDGHVRRVLKNGNVRPVKNRDGVYYTVSLSKNSISKSYSVHRLVAETFLNKPEGKAEVNHKDGNKHNNNLSNLEWVTQKENLIHAMEELNKFPWGKPARKVRCLDIETGNVVAEFPSLSDASKFLGKAYTRLGITHVCQGLQKTAYGYKWEYIE